MSSSASATSGAAGRYATALFEIARDGDALEAVERDVTALQAALDDSADLRAAIGSPIHTRAEQAAAMAGIAARMGLGAPVTKTLGLMAMNRRLFVLPGTLAGVRALIAEARGEMTAEVTSAVPLDATQEDALARTLKAGAGKDIKLDITVDPALIGGLVVKLGSRRIDTSIRAKLDNLQNAMKEVG